MTFISQVQATIGGDNPLFISNWQNSDGSLNWAGITKSLTSVLFFAASLLCLYYLIWGGIKIISSSGDKSKLEEARNKMVFAAIGLIVVASAFAVWRFVLYIIGADTPPA
jgi:threonine/homoserine/homoserine lactone efflux protein